MRTVHALVGSILLAVILCAAAPAGARTHDVVAAAQAQGEPSPGAAASAQAAPTAPAERHVMAYTLPPDLYKKAHDLGRIRFRFALISFVYGLVTLWIVLRWKFAATFRDWAERAFRRHVGQAVIFSPLLILALGILGLPADVYEEHVSRAFGLSVQGWGSWLWDWTKAEIILILLGTLLIGVLYAVIRKSPRRWWFYFWLVAMPIGIVLIFLSPMVIDPLFHKFEPLQQRDPGLTAALERMVQNAGRGIPPERMFWMGAGEKTTELNAYVTGIGASKRIVVWDNTIAKMTTPQIVYVAGHEMGHYALNHVPQGIIFGAIFSFLLFYIGFRLISGVLARSGGAWGVRGVDDWASLPALLILLSVFSFVANPISSGFSRHQEHQADQYGLEVTHGLTPDSSQIAAQSFQILGEVDLSDPDPNPLNVFLFYSHPPISDRVRFALSYNPWANGGHGEFVP